MLEEGARGPYLKMVSVQDDLGVALEVRKVYQVCTFLHLFPKIFILFFFYYHRRGGIKCCMEYCITFNVFFY